MQSGVKLFSVVPSVRTRSNGHKPVHVNIRRRFFPLLVTEHWHRLPRGQGVFFLEILQSHPIVALGTLLWLSLLDQ